MHQWKWLRNGLAKQCSTPLTWFYIPDTHSIWHITLSINLHSSWTSESRIWNHPWRHWGLFTWVAVGLQSPETYVIPDCRHCTHPWRHRAQLTWTALGLCSSKPPQGGAGPRSASESGNSLNFGVRQKIEYFLDFIQINGNLFWFELFGWRHLWSDWPLSADIWGTQAQGRLAETHWRMWDPLLLYCNIVTL